MKKSGSFIYTLFSLFTALVGHTIHDSLFLALMDFIFTPVA